MNRRFFLALGVLSSVAASPTHAAPAAPGAEHGARIDTAQLRILIADNEPLGAEHRGGYNGVAELKRPGDSHNLFVPQYAGLNLEHVFSGDAESFAWNIFEPRRAPMVLTRRSPARVELSQESTEHWPLRSRLTYEAEGDAINFTYCGTPLADAWKKHGYVGVFFASYAVNREFCFRARAVLRKFQNKEDVVRLYEQWSGEKVVLPASAPRGG
jgi:hypothetical protein